MREFLIDHEQWIMPIYVLISLSFYAIACFDCYVRKNWREDDAATMALLVCWFWPLFILMPFGWLWDKFLVWVYRRKKGAEA
jgi:hypothetical protein